MNNEYICCPKCGSKARIEGMMTTTLMGWTPYYDEQGNYHNENPNKTTTHWTCMKCGHNYTTTNK